MKPRSIRRRLITILLLLGTGIWVIAVLATSYYFNHLILRQADSYLEQQSALTQHVLRIVRYKNPQVSSDQLMLSRHGSRSGQELRIPSYQENSGTLAVNFWYSNSTVVVGKETPHFPDPTSEGYLNYDIESENGSTTWRILYRHNEKEGYWIGTGVDLSNLDYTGVITVWRMLLPMIIIMPVMLLLLVMGVRSGLRPLNALAHTIGQRSPNLLTPVDVADTPKELLPVVDSLNNLLGKLRRALENEKRFTANAAHELRTPLAAIQAEIQRLQHSPESVELQSSIERLHERVKRASRMVQQLLQLARLDPDGERSSETVNLTALVKEILAELGDEPSRRKLQVKLEGFDDQHFVAGNSEQLDIMIRNLVLNAFKHTPDKGEFLAAIYRDTTATTMVIANDCEPIPADEFPLLYTRFYRSEATDVSGSGLGLSIVHRIVELHNASLHISPWKGDAGFKVMVRFPGY